MQFLCMKHKHSRMSFKNNNYLFEYLRYWIHTNIIHIDYNMEFVQFLYQPMKIGFCTKFVRTYEA